MKKYIISLIPFVACTILSFIYGNKAPKEFPDVLYPYRTGYMLDYLERTWFFIGITMSAMFISMFLLGDTFDWIVKYFRNKREKTI